MPKRRGKANDDCDVVVVAAKWAWPQYLDASAYMCQEGRSFRKVDRMAFYTKNQILETVPRILEGPYRVVLSRSHHVESEKLRQTIAKFIELRPDLVGQRFQLFLLSSPSDLNTIKLSAPIPNNLVNEGTKKRRAFTQGQRYVASTRLLTARATSDLE